MEKKTNCLICNVYNPDVINDETGNCKFCQEKIDDKNKIKELEDKLRRRNLQIKDLKQEIEGLRVTGERLNNFIDNNPEVNKLWKKDVLERVNR